MPQILNKSALTSYITECVKKMITEGQINDPAYTHYAVLKPINKIVFGWDYSDIDPADLRNNRRDYFTVDMEDFGFNPKEIRILSKRAVIGAGLDPDNDECWDNGGEYTK